MKLKTTTWAWFAIPFLMVTAQIKAAPPDSILRQIERGDIAHLPPTIAVGLFDPDPFFDFAEYADNKVTVYRNLGNGTFWRVWEKEVSGDVTKMEWRRVGDGIPDITSWSDLHVYFSDGRKEVITNEEMKVAPMKRGTGSFMSFSHPLDFREVWRSEPQWQPSPRVAVGDFDNDGRIEMLYTFSEWPGHERELVVYKHVGSDSFIIEWDTVVTEISSPMRVTDIDADGRPEIVFGRQGRLVLLECTGPGQYRFYETNMTYTAPPYAIIEADVNHNGIRELILTTSQSPPPPGDATTIYVGHFLHKDTVASFISFAIQMATYYYYVFDLAVGQVDGTGTLEIVLGSGSPFTYLWYDGWSAWRVRRTNVGVGAGLLYGMFVNLDADSALEFVGGGVGPIGRGSCYALKYVSDTTWTVLWRDSTLRTAPMKVRSGVLDGEFVVVGANQLFTNDTLWSQLHVYRPSGEKVGVWQRDTTSVHDLQLIDLENDGGTHLIFPISSNPAGNHLAVYKYYGPTGVQGHAENRAGGFTLYQNYPNPFNPRTTIEYDVTKPGLVVLKVFNTLGQEVKTLVAGWLNPGRYEATLDATELASGVYLYRFEQAGLVAVRKFVVVK